MIAKAYKAGCGVLIACSLVAVLLTVKETKSEELPVVPNYQKILEWGPLPDGTMEVVYQGIRFRYSILDWKPAPRCQAVLEIVGEKRLRWVTHIGMFAHQYLTTSFPMAFKRDGDGEWHWMNLKTYEER